MTRSVLGVMAASLLLAACSDQKKAEGPPPAPAVGVSPARLEQILRQSSYTARVQAIARVDLRAQVQAVLAAKPVRDGAPVKKDDLLFELDHAPFKAAVDLAQANLQSAKAQEKLAQLNYERAMDLRNKAAGTVANADTMRANLLSAQAAVQARQADLDTAQINLGYTYIKAPMSGRIGRTAFSVGDLLGPSSNALVTLVSDDPIYVVFPVPSSTFLAVQERRTKEKVVVRLTLANGSTYPQTGEIAFSDVVANAQTDSISVTARFPNPGGVLVDQQLVYASVVDTAPTPELVVPQSALVQDQRGAYVLVVDKDETVQVKRVKTGAMYGENIVVTEGLQPGDRAIVDGLMKVRPGVKVVARATEPSIKQ